MLNKWIGCGRLTKDVDGKTSGETKIARYSLAIDRKYSKSDDKQTDYIPCVCFGKTAEFAEKYLHKGMKIIVVGRIQTGSYEKDGVKHYTTDIIVEEHEFAESKSAEANSTAVKDDGEFMKFDASAESMLPF